MKEAPEVTRMLLRVATPTVGPARVAETKEAPEVSRMLLRVATPTVGPGRVAETKEAPEVSRMLLSCGDPDGTRTRDLRRDRAAR
jgi:hypothetical protein